jgi:hypothetical protein
MDLPILLLAAPGAVLGHLAPCALQEIRAILAARGAALEACAFIASRSTVRSSFRGAAWRWRGVKEGGAAMGAASICVDG